MKRTIKTFKILPVILLLFAILLLCSCSDEGNVSTTSLTSSSAGTTANYEIQDETIYKFGEYRVTKVKTSEGEFENYIFRELYSGEYLFLMSLRQNYNSYYIELNTLYIFASHMSTYDLSSADAKSTVKNIVFNPEGFDFETEKFIKYDGSYFYFSGRQWKSDNPDHGDIKFFKIKPDGSEFSAIDESSIPD